jgi:hypothetical protein
VTEVLNLTALQEARDREEALACVPRTLFRCFDVEAHARRLLEGHVWISTVGFLRSTDRARGDPHEAMLTYQPGAIDSNDQSEETKAKMDNLARASIACNGGRIDWRDSGAGNIKVEVRPWDGYLLCMTTVHPSAAMKSAFGQHCVRIDNAPEFVALVAQHMGRAEWCACDPVDYSGRVYRGTDRLPDDAPFVGPEGNVPEAEFRIYWPPPDGAIIEPFEVFVPGVANLCSML